MALGPVSRQEFDALTAQLNKLQNISAVYPVTVDRTGGGIHIGSVRTDAAVHAVITAITGISFTTYAGLYWRQQETDGNLPADWAAPVRYLRWAYAWTSVSSITEEAPPEGVTIEGGALPDTVDGSTNGTAYNLSEFQNGFPVADDPDDGLWTTTYTNTLGNGIVLPDMIDNYPGFKLMPVPVGSVVAIYRIPNTADPQTVTGEYWFDRPNAVDGSCEPFYGGEG